MKCAIVVDPTLPVGLIANTAAVLSMSIGRTVDGIVGDDVVDKDGALHRGITRAVVPILKGDGTLIRAIRDKLVRQADDGLFHVDFCDLAQRCHDYDQYTLTLRSTPGEDLNYLGIAICGPAKKVNALTGSLGLLR